MRILVVEDDLVVRDFVERSLKESGFGVDGSSSASESEQLALSGSYDVLIVDLRLPDGDGLDLIARLRAQGLSTPVLILSARRSVDDRVVGLEKGADDYLTKPFAIAELIARVHVLLKRRRPMQQEPTRLQAGDLELDLIRRVAHRDGSDIPLTQLEFALLKYLISHAGHVVTRSMLLNDVWRISGHSHTNMVDVHMHRLRQKIDNGRRPIIRTIRGVGYVLTDLRKT